MRPRRHAIDHVPQTSRSGCVSGGPHATKWFDAEIEIDIGLDNHPGSTLLPGCLSIQLDGQSAPSLQVPFRCVFPGRRRSSAAVAPIDARMGAREGATPLLGGLVRPSRATGRLMFGGRSLPRPTRQASDSACAIHELIRRGVQDSCNQMGHPHAVHRTATQARSRSRQRPAGRTDLLLAEGPHRIGVPGRDGERDGYRTVALTGRGGRDRMAIAVAADRGPWRGAGSVSFEDDRRPRRLGAEGDMIRSINGLWKLPELWKPTSTPVVGSHKFFAKRPTVERFARAPTGPHQRLLDPDDSEDSHRRNRVRRCRHRNARSHTPASAILSRVAAHFLPVPLSSAPTGILAATCGASLPTTEAVGQKQRPRSGMPVRLFAGPRSAAWTSRCHVRRSRSAAASPEPSICREHPHMATRVVRLASPEGQRRRTVPRDERAPRDEDEPMKPTSRRVRVASWFRIAPAAEYGGVRPLRTLPESLQAGGTVP